MWCELKLARLLLVSDDCIWWVMFCFQYKCFVTSVSLLHTAHFSICIYWPFRHHLSSSQFSASSLGFDLKFMYFSFKDWVEHYENFCDGGARYISVKLSNGKYITAIFDICSLSLFLQLQRTVVSWSFIILVAILWSSEILIYSNLNYRLTSEGLMIVAIFRLF